MLRFSTGLRRALMTSYGLGTMMNGGVIYVFGGSAPATADDAPGSLPLGIVTTEGNVFVTPGDPNSAGLMLQVVDGEFLANAANTWRLRGRAGGIPTTATWWRWCWANPDDHAYSVYYPRVDGDMGEAFQLSSYEIGPGSLIAIGSFMCGMFAQASMA